MKPNIYSHDIKNSNARGGPRLRRSYKGVEIYKENTESCDIKNYDRKEERKIKNQWKLILRFDLRSYMRRMVTNIKQ